MEYAIITVVLIAVMYFGFKIGWFLAKQSDDSDKTEAVKTLEDLYCFECEIEMPVKEKDGRLYCTNCKLYHYNDYL